ncbi:helix-turn-helix transcriptional regulator [Virgibacillus sp. NKC19-16]|uniref:helix-turn-helix domain-containing protein n=1 Tax=Virgibacillus salidurans TaxID=2831673 RepID=UPI001F234E4E|nr:helix-turn-helix transcriptional regulator [Virgibacillus sp. NKC19-16]UJL45786.1 helix-turn-helix transcriptional regulator [Virgibacillus sp. NKC19-16]
MMEGFPHRLENLRDNKDLSMREISRKIGFSEDAYGKWERGERIPTFETMMKLAEFHHVSLDYLAYGKEFQQHKEEQDKQKAFNNWIYAFHTHEIDTSILMRKDIPLILAKEDLKYLIKNLEWTVEQRLRE